MLLTMLVLTFIVFAIVNLEPNLKKTAIQEVGSRTSPEEIASWLEKEGLTGNLFGRYFDWLWDIFRHGSMGHSYRESARSVNTVLWESLGTTGVLAAVVFAFMIPLSLLMGVLAGMREGSIGDRLISMLSIISTATPEYVSGILMVAIFAFSLSWLPGSVSVDGFTAASITIPVAAIVIYGVGYIARITRASMAEVMTSQYIRTAHLKGVSFPSIVMRHALRNALIAPFTVILLQFPWLLTGVVVVEFMFNIKGFGWYLIQSVETNDLFPMLAISLVSVAVVLSTQLLSDIGYVLLNPRIRVR